MIESCAIRVEMSTLLFSSVLFSKLSPELSFVVAKIQYGGSKKTGKKRVLIRNRYFKIQKVLDLKQDT